MRALKLSMREIFSSPEHVSISLIPEFSSEDYITFTFLS